jgi:L-amino acid N-acyltransferase YncA
LSGRFTRAAVSSDTPAIVAIYNQGIEERGATFETIPRTIADITAWFDNGYPVYVCGENETVRAFAAAFPYRARHYYDGVREFSVYVERDGRGRRFGTVALAALIENAAARGWWKLVSRVFPTNLGSRKLCASLGFREVGTYEKHGKLDGKWLDVIIVEKLLI